MDFSNLIRKPDFKYTPEEVRLSEPDDLLDVVLSEDTSVSIDEERTIVIDAVVHEIDRLSEMSTAIQNSITDIHVAIPSEYQEAVGKETIQMSDYLASLRSDDYGPAIIRELYESHAADAVTGNPGILALPIIDTLKSQFTTDLALFSDEVSYGIPKGCRSDKAMLTSMRRAVYQSREVRAEILRTVNIASKAINGLEIIKAVSAEELLGVRDSASNLADKLEKLKAIVQLSVSCYTLDWRNAMTSCRSFVYSEISSVIGRSLFALYSQFDQAYIQPLIPDLKRIARTAAKAEAFERKARKRRDSEDDSSNLQSVHKILCSVLKVVDTIDTNLTASICDLHAARMQSLSLSASSARSVKSVIFARKLSLQIDAVIEALRAFGSSTIEDLDEALEADVTANDKCCSIASAQPILEEQSFELADAGLYEIGETGLLDYSDLAGQLLFDETVTDDIAFAEEALKHGDYSWELGPVRAKPVEPKEEDSRYVLGTPGMPWSLQLDPRGDDRRPWETL